MWRWPVIAQKKEASAKARAKINTLHVKIITVAAEKGSDPDLNTALADAIHTAKKEWVATEVIERAIKRGAGLDKDATKVEEIIYEWYAPGGVGIIIRALTDNRNRTAPSIRHIFSAFGGNLGETGTVSNFAFEYRGVITVENVADIDAFEMTVLETPAEDYRIEDGTATVITERTNMIEARKILETHGYAVTKAAFEYIPKTYVEVTDPDNVLKIYRMLEELGGDEDVEVVWNNADISDTLWQEAEAKVDSSRFRT